MTTTALQTSTTTARNPFAAYAEAMAPRRLDGRTMKFVKGDYLVGKDGAVLPPRTQLVAIMNSLMVGWVKWRGGKATGDSRMGYVADGFLPPRRSDLDDDQSDRWETDRDGDLVDPWQFTNQIVFIDPATKGIFTFSTSSRGGFNAIADLCKLHAMAPARSYAIVSLDVGSYQHADKTIGRVRFPVFAPVGRVDATPYDEALARSRGENASPPALETPASAGLPPSAPLDFDDGYAGPSRDEIDSDVPF